MKDEHFFFGHLESLDSSVLRFKQLSGWQLSCVAIVLRGNCPAWQLSCVAIVLRGNCPAWQLSRVALVPGGTCPGWHLSRVAIVPGGNCPGWQLSRVAIVPGGNCPGWQLSRVAIVPGGNFPGLQLSRVEIFLLPSSCIINLNNTIFIIRHLILSNSIRFGLDHVRYFSFKLGYLPTLLRVV